jgi:predicted esterase YcpF (UPF0227 family)
VVSPDLPFDPAEVKTIVDNIVTEFSANRKPHERLIFVGTSLGGFYSNFFAHVYDCAVVLVNPSVNPQVTLASRLGSNKNYGTGQEFSVTANHLEELDAMRLFIDENYNSNLVNLFVAQDDDVIPHDVALSAYKFPASVTVTEEGGHRFTDHWDLVVNRVGQLIA